MALIFKFNKLKSNRINVVHGGPIFFVTEDFEDALTAEWFVGGSGNMDYTPALIGGESAHLDASGSQYLVLLADGILNHAEVFGKVLFKVVTLPSTFSQFVQHYDDAFNKQFEVVILSSGAVQVSDNGVGVFTSTSDVISVGTTYRLYWHYKKSTGSNNGICEVGFSTTDVRPTSGTKFAGGNTGQTTQNAQSLNFQSINGMEVIFDEIQLSTEAFD